MWFLLRKYRISYLNDKQLRVIQLTPHTVKTVKTNTVIFRSFMQLSNTSYVRKSHKSMQTNDDKCGNVAYFYTRRMCSEKPKPHRNSENNEKFKEIRKF